MLAPTSHWKSFRATAFTAALTSKPWFFSSPSFVQFSLRPLRNPNDWRVSRLLVFEVKKLALRLNRLSKRLVSSPTLRRRVVSHWIFVLPMLAKDRPEMVSTNCALLK